MPKTYPLFALSAPLILLPLEKILPYPYLLEELAKALILKLAWESSEDKLKPAALVGLLFALSENLFYLTDAVTLGNLGEWGKRLLITTPLHIITCLIIAASTLISPKLLPLGILLAILLHSAFNILA